MYAEMSIAIELLLLGIALNSILIMNIKNNLTPFLLIMVSIFFTSIALIFSFQVILLGIDVLLLFIISSIFGIIPLSIRVYIGLDIIFPEIPTSKKLMITLTPVLMASFFLIMILISNKIYPGVIVYEGDPISEAYFNILGTPLMSVMAVLVSIGGLVKFLTNNKAGNYVANILIFFIPVMMWLLVLLGVIPPPKAFDDVFLGNIAYAFIYLLVVLILIMIMFAFQNVRNLQI
ncbi:MAG: hypothetical protein ACP6IY_21285 [Promethearchaeia archaeon]